MRSLNTIQIEEGSKTCFRFFVGAVVVLIIGFSATADEFPFICPSDGSDSPLIGLPTDVVAKFIFISFNAPAEEDSIAPGDHTTDLRSTWIDPLPEQFASFFETESRGAVSIACSTIVNPLYPGKQWIAAHAVEEYRAGEINEYAGYRSSFWAEVHAEMVFRIYSTYVDTLGRANPFEDCDYLFFVPRYKVWEAGWGGIDTHELTNIPVHIFPQSIGGNTSIQVGGRDPFSDETLTHILLHEFGHNAGARHVPTSSSHVEGQSVGAYAPMRPTTLFGHGFSPFHHKSLMEMGWLDPPTLIDEQTTGIFLSDLQGPRVQDTSQVLKVPLIVAGGPRVDESFYLTYHGGLGYAAAYPTRGVAIWHYNSGSWDNETSRGCFVDPRVEDEENLEADPEFGIDLRDRYWSENDPADLFFIYWDPGHEQDFFPVAIDSITEFSYRTNPHTYAGSSTLRLSPQLEPTSLAIIMSKLPDGVVSVDILPAPREEILSPTGEVTVSDTSPLSVTWADYFDDENPEYDVLDEVELWFSSTGGADYDSVAVVAYHNFNLSWYDSRYTTPNGRFKLVFSNTLTDVVGCTDFPDTITVEGSGNPWEAVLAPTGDDNVVLGETYDVIWSDSWPDGTFTRIDLLYSTDSGNSYEEWEADIAYISAGGLNTYEWTPTGIDETASARVMLRFYSAGGQADRESEENFVIMDLGAVYEDVTGTAMPDPYSGAPNDIVPIDVTAAGSSDLLISITSEEGASSGRLYLNDSQQGGSIELDDESLAYLPDNPLIPGFDNLAVADFDADGDQDFFACRLDSLPSQLLRRHGSTFSSCTDTAVASNNKCPPPQPRIS